MPTDLSVQLDLLSEPTRLRLLSLLEREELGVGELTRILQVAQSTVSRHLKALHTAGWLQRRAEGTSSWFRMDRSRLTGQRAALWQLVAEDFQTTRQHAEDDHRLAATLDDRRVDSAGFFGRIASGWDDVRRELFGDDFGLTTLLALIDPHLRVADLGCGTGWAVSQLAPVVANVIGVDREQAMLDAAAIRCTGRDNISLRLGSLDALPIEAGEADVALMMLVLHHVQDVEATLGEIARILPKRGRVVIVDMVAHERAEYRHTMGHVHLGFAREALTRQMRSVGLETTLWRLLPSPSEAQGPPLFLTVATRQPEA